MTPETFEQNIPAEMKALRRFVAFGPDPDSGKPKTPLLVSNKKQRASTRKPQTWVAFDTAMAFYRKYANRKDLPEYGIGFVFAEPAKGETPLVFIDLDDAVTLDAAGTPTLHPWAADYVEPFLGKAYCELSISGHGIHIIARGVLPKPDVCGGTTKFPTVASEWAKEKKRVPELALFASGKYCTLSGDVLDAGKTIGEDCSSILADIWQRAGIQAKGTDKACGPVPDLENLPKVAGQRVPKAVRDELKNCTVEKSEDRSAARYKVYVQAAQKLEPEEIYALVVRDHDDWYTASGAAEHGYEQTWQDIVRSCAKAETAAKDFEVVQEAEQEEKAKVAASWKDLGMPCTEVVTKEGTVHAVVYGGHAIVVFLTKHPDWKGRLRYNTFTLKVELDGQPLDESLTHVAEAVRAYCSWDREPQLALVRQAVLEAAMLNPVNPLAQMLESLQWDGTPRIGDWLVRAGCEEDEGVARDVGRKWLIGLVARALEPGCKFDNVLILEGDQGLKKSTLFAMLAGRELFTDSAASFERDGLMVMHGHWIVELSELATFKRAEVDHVKRFMSSQVDTFRPPYGHITKAFPRHFVVVGSTNDEEYLNDPTGARRYWPVKVERELDVALVAAEREQLLAEAVVAFKAGEPWWHPKTTTELQNAQERRYVGDPLEPGVLEWITNNPEEELQAGALMKALGVQSDRMDLLKRVTTILRRAGWVSVRRRALGTRAQFRVWMSAERAAKLALGQDAEIIQIAVTAPTTDFEPVTEPVTEKSVEDLLG